MKFIRPLFLLLFLAGVGYPGNATEYSPWFSPLFECDARFSYQYANIEKFNSHSSDFSVPSQHHTCHASVGITPWPYWNIEGELFLTHSSQVSCSYEASRLTLRYNWLDDGDGAPCS
jgi:hypothetical protein